MATDLCVVYDVGASLKINEPVNDRLVPRQILGLDGRPIRRTVLPAGAADGGITGLTARFGPRLITFRGEIVIGDGDNVVNPMTDIDAYLARVNAVSNAWRTGLEALLNTDFTLGWTPTGAAARSLTCRYGFQGGEWQTDGDGVVDGPKTFTFGLFCASG